MFGKCNAGIGIVGGLGPETSAKFLLNVVTRVREKTGIQPHMILDNVSLPIQLEKNIILGKKSQMIFKILKQSIIRLNTMNVDIIVIPCNTVHIFFERLQRISKVPILNIIDEAILNAKNCQRIGLLATTTTVSARIYQKRAAKQKMKVILPNKISQEQVSEIIIKILHNSASEKDKKFLQFVMDELLKKGAQAILLGCTDLDLLINDKSEIKIIDSTKALEDAIVNFILKGVENG